MSAPQPQPRIRTSLGIAYHGKLALNMTPQGVELHWFAGGLTRASFSRPLLAVLKQYGRTREKVDKKAPGRRFDPLKLAEGHYLLATLPKADYVLADCRIARGGHKRLGHGIELFRIGGPRW